MSFRGACGRVLLPPDRARLTVSPCFHPLCYAKLTGCSFIFTVQTCEQYWSSYLTLRQKEKERISQNAELIIEALNYFNLKWDSHELSLKLHEGKRGLNQLCCRPAGDDSHTATEPWIDRMDQKGLQLQKGFGGGGCIHAMILIPIWPLESNPFLNLFSMVAGLHSCGPLGEELQSIPLWES